MPITPPYHAWDMQHFGEIINVIYFYNVVCSSSFIVYLWRRSGSAVEYRTLDRENPVTNPLHIVVVAMLCHDKTKSLYSRTPDERPSLSYDHISCDGQWFLFVYESLTSDHPSYTTTPMWFWGWSYKRGSTVRTSMILGNKLGFTFLH